MSTLWSTAQKRSQKQSSTSFDLFKTLSERSKLDEERPNTIDYAVVEKIVETTSLKKLPGVTVKPNLLNTEFFVVKNPKTYQYFRLDEKEKFLWDKMDGEHTIRDLALEYFNHYGSFGFEKIIELVYDLKKKTLLDQAYVDIFEKLSLWAKSKTVFHLLLARLKQALSIEFPIKKSNEFFELIHRRFFFIFFKEIVLFGLGIFSLAGAAIFLFRTFFQPTVLFSKENLAVELITLIFLTAISLCLHEIAHGVATKHFGREVPKAGFLLYLFWPAFFVDTTDMWLEEKEKRIAVSLAGPVTDFIQASAASFIAYLLPSSLVGDIAFKFALATYASVFVNMNPLVEWDGYFVFMDVLGIPCLRKRSLHFIQHDFIKKLRTRKKFTREDMMYSVFGLMSFVWSVLAVFMALRFWQQHLSQLF